MPWLVVLGEGFWQYDREHRFSAGKHEVTEEIATQARESGLRKLLVFESEPAMAGVNVEDGSPLTLEDFKRMEGAHLAPPPAPESDDAEIPQFVTRRAQYKCPFCPVSEPTFRPSEPALRRHILKVHKSTN